MFDGLVDEWDPPNAPFEDPATAEIPCPNDPSGPMREVFHGRWYYGLGEHPKEGPTPTPDYGGKQYSPAVSWICRPNYSMVKEVREKACGDFEFENPTVPRARQRAKILVRALVGGTNCCDPLVDPWCYDPDYSGKCEESNMWEAIEAP